MSTSLTLREIAESGTNILDEAYGIYRSKTYTKFLFVEGVNDKNFLKRKGFDEDKIYYLGMCGKPTVISSHSTFQSKDPYKSMTNIAFLIDNDYDHVLNNINIHKNLFINSVCNNSGDYYFNDLEGYLVNSESIYSWLDEFGLKRNEINLLKKNVELESRRIGKYKAANELLKKKNNLPEKSSIIFKYEIEDYLDCKNFIFLERAFESRLRVVSDYKNLVDELCMLANQIDQNFRSNWALSRGHDITELISLYLYHKHNGISLSSKEVEQYLRLSIDTKDLDKYSVYADLKSFLNV